MPSKIERGLGLHRPRVIQRFSASVASDGGDTSLLQFLDLFAGFPPQPRPSTRTHLQPGKDTEGGDYAPLDERTQIALDAKASGKITDDIKIDVYHPRLLFDRAWKVIEPLLIPIPDDNGLLDLRPDMMNPLVAALRTSATKLMREARRKLASQAMENQRAG